ncbi:hypothetical protein DFH07DRAFT_405070 [Mycena maculata]|uniref:Uncharacterized protein n=1 Tax=Mycena maculata TaxID=230809 RepID=A0AAD7JGB7_9AGAR|nr:hypothetical protein DFH07DRAFT_405070 [Mycena maculata]
MRKLLDAMVLDKRGKEIFDDWANPRAMDIACNIISAQMANMVTALSTAPSVSKLTPEFLRSWSLDRTVAQPADLIAPDVVRLLFAAVNADKSLAKNKKKKNDTALYSIIGQLTSRRSQQSLDFAGPMTLFWWKNGCSRETIEVLQSLGLSKGFDSALTMVGSIADFCIQDARVAARNPAGFMLNWDNYNQSTSEFVEQRPGGPSKVQSGTYAIVYRLRNPNPTAMALSPLLTRAESAPDLDFKISLYKVDHITASNFSERVKISASANVFRNGCKFLSSRGVFGPDPASEFSNQMERMPSPIAPGH